MSKNVMFIIKKFLCYLTGHDYHFGKGLKLMWCSYCGKDFTKEVKEEMIKIEKEILDRNAKYLINK